MRWYEGNGISLYDQEVLNAIEEDMSTRAYGTVYFAHLLVPHGPYVMREDCSFDYGTDQWLRDAHTMGFNVNTPESRGMRYCHYLGQSKCTLKILNDFFDAMRKQGIDEDSVIIIHGDHGSAIYEYSISTIAGSLLTSSDFRDAFSTLFAAKFPQGSFQITTETSSLEMLLNQVSRKLSTEPLPELSNQPFIYLFDGPELNRKDIDIFASP